MIGFNPMKKAGGNPLNSRKNHEDLIACCLCASCAFSWP
jgi:hypothetical protein